MYKKTITYTDYNGNERTEDFYFNISEAEATELSVSYDGGIQSYLEKIVNADDQNEIVQQFKKIIKYSYGVKSDDGRRFIKSDEIADAFVQSPAYSILFMELATNTDSAIAFVNGITPNVSNKEEIVEKFKQRNEEVTQNADHSNS